MPKINWADDDQPRWEPRYRPRRDRQPRLPAARPYADRLPLLVRPFDKLRAQDERDNGRRPLHLIWGEPRREMSS